MNLTKSLKTIFGYDKFRDPQRRVIKYALRGLDELVILPTGSGKSICYQLTALLQDGLTIIISPLKSLIKDQIINLQRREINAEAYFGDMGIKKKREVLQKLISNTFEFKILYTTPETISNNISFIDSIQTLYLQGKITRFVIDEAHCISMWGNDFRPSYRQLKNIRTYFPNIPIMALTATATPNVQDDIVKLLKFRQYKKFMKSYFRSNLKLKIYKLPVHKSSKTAKFSEIKNTLILSNLKDETGIIYCSRKKICEEFASYLNSFGMSALPYHAGLKKKIKDENQDKWQKEEVKIIVATIAFGMGIDKSNVRFVMHHDLPTNIESYYQEIGRVGRDGKDSFCVLFYSMKDYGKVKCLLNWSTKQNIRNIKEFEKRKLYRRHLFRKLENLLGFLENTHTCRHQMLSNYLGEDTEFMCGNSCDNCIQRV